MSDSPPKREPARNGKPGRLIPGKIVVYPSIEGLGLIRIEDLAEKLPNVAAKLSNGLWTKEAEAALLKQ